MATNGMRRMGSGPVRRRQQWNLPSILLLFSSCIGVCLILRLSILSGSGWGSSAKAKPSSAVVVESTEPPHLRAATTITKATTGRDEQVLEMPPPSRRQRAGQAKTAGHGPGTTTGAIAARMAGHEPGENGILVVDKKSKAAATAKVRTQREVERLQREKRQVGLAFTQQYHPPFTWEADRWAAGLTWQFKRAEKLARGMDPAIARELEEALAPPSIISGMQVRTLRIPSTFPDFVQHNCTSEGRFLLLSTADLERKEQPEKCPVSYPRDMMKIFKRLPESYRNRTFLARFGDRTSPLEYPTLTKARLINDSNAILLPLNYDHHYRNNFIPLLGDGDPVPYHDKTPIAIWRGTSTGGCYDPALNCSAYDYGTVSARRDIVRRWALANHAKVDVGFDHLVQTAMRDYFKEYKPYIKRQKSMRELLTYRYLIAVEGNDVPTGLKWMLASNSTVFMVPPRFETWMLEGLLKPWVHYVPLAHDFSDIPDKVLWCERNLGECEAIARRATDFVVFHGDTERTWDLAARRLQAYLDTIRVEVVAEEDGPTIGGDEERAAAL